MTLRVDGDLRASREINEDQRGGFSGTLGGRPEGDQTGMRMRWTLVGQGGP